MHHQLSDCGFQLAHIFTKNVNSAHISTLPEMKYAVTSYPFLKWDAGGGGGVLTDKWYTGMLKGFEVHFSKFWLSSHTQCAQFAKLCVFWKI